MAYVAPLRRSVLPLLLTFSLAACSTDTLDIDGSARVASIPAQRMERRQIPQAETQASYPMQAAPAYEAYPAASAAPVQPSGPLPMIDSDEAMAQQGLAPDGRQLGAPPRILGQLHSNPSMASQPMQTASLDPQPMGVTEEGVSMDEGLGVGQAGGSSLAQEQAMEIAESNPQEPVIGDIGTDNPTLVSPGQPRMAIPEPDPLQAELDRTYPSEQPIRQSYPQPVQEVAMLPRPADPLAQPEIRRPQPGAMPASERSCRAALQRMGVKFQDVRPIYNGPACGIPYPIKVYGFASNIAMKPAVTLNCQVTLAFAKWVKNELNPSARYRYWSGVKTIIPMGGYSCRRMNSSKRNPWSEHARGNAIDVGKFVLNNGKKIDVRKPGFFAFREKGLLNAVRSDSCKYFHTVLGPGSDPHHKDHFHFDLRSRKSGYRHCD
jgi:hypothetical protein